MKRLLLLILFCLTSLWGMERELTVTRVTQETRYAIPALFKDLPTGVLLYLESLPKIVPPLVNNDNPAEQNIAHAVAITDFLLQFGGYTDKKVAGREILQNKVLDCIANNKPIGRCMPGFPVSNAQKLPFDDKHAFSLGDLVGLLTRRHVSGEIAKLHKPGSALAIYWEPFIHTMNDFCQEMLGRPYLFRGTGGVISKHAQRYATAA